MAVALVAGEARTLIAADVVGAVREHITGSENIYPVDTTYFAAIPSSLLTPHPPVFALVLVRHGAALAAPAVVTVTLRVQARTIDTTVAGSVQAVI